MPLRLLALCLLLATTLVAADERTTTNSRLEQVRGEITKLQQRVARQQAKKGSVSNALRKAELAVAKTVRELAELTEKIGQRQRDIEGLRARKQAVSRQLSAHRESLHEQLRAAYRMGQTPLLQMLLKQQDPAQLSRSLRYYDYFNRARLAAISEAESLLTELDQLSRREAEASEALSQARQQAQQRHAALQSQQTERSQALAKLGQQLRTSGGKLKRLEGDEQRLQQLLDELGQILADIPPPPREQEPFKKRRGKLPWPVEGRVLVGFNGQQAGSPLRNQGWVIDADPGETVEAVHYGHVVFADWLQGFGLIAIVDHGAGYMSLYGNNQALFKEAGDWVASGEQIATAGDGSGQLSSGVYFEIRRKGRPVNPKRWLRSSQR